jgi:hypothetical protein
VTRGVDISKFQSASAMDGWDFVILNVEDPGFGEKASRAHELGIPWDIYKWIYPPGATDSAGRPIPDAGNGAESFAIAKDLVDRTNIPGREPGYWGDYEQAGVTASQVREWFAAADAAHVKAGWYTYLHILNAEGNHAPDRPLWLAYYPHPNDGSYQPSMSDNARARRAKTHQFTSTNDTLDVNIVLDTEWWDDWTGDDGGPRSERRPRTIVEDDEMIVAIPDPSKRCALRGTPSRFYAVSGGVIVHVFFDEPNQFGLPKELVGDVFMAPISRGDLEVLRSRTAQSSGVPLEQIP